MSKALVEMAFCGVCGVDVRDESQFCYNCGFRFADVSDTAGKRETDPAARQPLPDSNRGRSRVSGRKNRKVNAARPGAAAGVSTSGRKKSNVLRNIYVRAAQGIKPLSPERRFLFIAAAFAAASFVLVSLALFLR